MFQPNIEYKLVTQIIPYVRNSKTHPKEQVDKIARQISEVGFTQPILIDSQDVVIAGHGRLEAAKSLGMTEVPVIKMSHLTEEQAMAYRIADNKVAESYWDLPLLAFELGTLERRDFDITLTGFGLEEAKIVLSSYSLKDESGAPSQPGGAGEYVQNEKTGSQEMKEGDFQQFQHSCPKCNFQWN